MDVQTFLKISEVLTGVAPLSPDLADEFLRRISVEPVGSKFDQLGVTFLSIFDLPEPEWENAVRAQVISNPDLKALVLAIILCWYTGDPVPDPKPPKGRSADAYFAALVWPVTLAHPPALSGGYFGHWTYRPDVT